MRSIATCGIYHDTRRAKQDNTYPIKLRVTHMRKPRLFKTHLSITKDDFKKSYLARSPKGIFIRLNDELRDIESRGREIINEMETFSFTTFEKEFYDIREYPNDVIYYYQRELKKYNENSQVSTYNNYKAALKLLLKIVFDIHIEPKSDIVNLKIKPIPFEKFNPKSLKKFEKEAIRQGKSTTTVSIYLKSLKTIFNLAIREKAISDDIYPFGVEKKGKYKIKEVENNKRGLSKSELSLLAGYSPIKDSARAKAIDFWFLSLYLRGMNMTDILQIKFKNYTGDTISFIRTKTKGTKSKNTKLEIKLVPRAKEILEKYTVKNNDPENYIFPYLKKGDSIKEIKKKVGNFIRSVNQAMRKIAKEVGINKSCSTMFARHTWATLAVGGGINPYTIMESIGHSKLTTTQNYIKNLGVQDIDHQLFGKENE